MPTQFAVRRRGRAAELRELLLIGLNLAVLSWVAISSRHAAVSSISEAVEPISRRELEVGGAGFGGLPGGGAAAALDAGALAAGGAALRPNAPPDLPMEVYARGPNRDAGATAKVAALLSASEKKQLRELCGRTLYHSLQTGWVSHDTGMWTFVATGACVWGARRRRRMRDLPLMWIRDSAVQIGVLLPRLARRPALRLAVEGAIRAQAFYITQDPYANGYYPEWRHPDEHNKGDRTLGRGGWVGVRNYELDSGAYFLNLLWNYILTPGVNQPHRLIAEPLIFDAANLLVDVWVREQRHNASSPYRYVDLPNGGLGAPVRYTGMTWSGFRPSDDASQLGFPVAANMYAAAGLERALELNRQVWRSDEFAAKAGQLLSEIRTGIDRHGVVGLAAGPRVYAYEVDGLGNTVTDFDDPNIPSLLSIPLLGYRHYNRAVYAATRARLLSKNNRRAAGNLGSGEALAPSAQRRARPSSVQYYVGKEFKGMGSPHTPPGMVWALGLFTEALTATAPAEQAAGLRTLLKLQCGDGLMHESVHVDDLKRCTRRWFEWANALLVASVEQLLGLDCDAAAVAFHAAVVEASGGGAEGTGDGMGVAMGKREKADGQMAATGPLTYQPIEASLQWDVIYKSKVADWKGYGWTIRR
eukprot:scaffold20.g7759.t1